jgi:putative transferase (TIGR04331 family)
MSYFLATTALDEFWDKSKKIIFAGEWCKLYENKSEWCDLEYEDIPFIWKNGDSIIKGTEYCDKIYEKALLELQKNLNQYHNIDKELHYYRIISGNWLVHFIHQAYDKYLTVKRAFDIYPDLSTWLLDNDQYYIPFEYNDYLQNIVGDRYSLQQYSSVLSALNYDFAEKSISSPIEQKKSYHINRDIKSKIYSIIAYISTIISTSIYKKNITITAPYFGHNLKKYILKLLLKSRFRCIYDEMKYEITIGYDIDRLFRKKTLNLNGNEFEIVLSKILLENLPIIFLEGFVSFRKKVDNLAIHKSDIFFSTTALHGNNIYKFYVGEHYKNIKICNMQHGSGYGFDYYSNTEQYEKSIADRYYTAGWKSNGKTVPLSIPKFLHKKIRSSRQPDIILFGMTERPRYIFRLCSIPMSTNYLNEDLDNTLKFLGLVQTDKLLIRLFPKTPLGWATSKRIKERFGSCNFDDLTRPFDRKLAESIIFISNNIGTTFLEALAQDKPSVVFISREGYRFRADAQPYFELLEKVKILHFSPEAAAKHLNNIYGNIKLWWESKNVQEARTKFIEKYARCRKNWCEEWVQEFERLL